LPITFAEEELQLVRFSMPTKLPEYLASGTPTLVYGPRGCAPVEFCIQNQVGIVQSERSVASLVNVLVEVRKDRQEFRNKGDHDQKVAEATVSARAMRERLRTILYEATTAADTRD
jgi:glycosyltransferase involved in cell wall biosynthesis